MAYSVLPITTPDAGGDVEVERADVERRPQRGAHLVGHGARAAVVGDALGDDGELVAAEPGHRVAAADDAPQPLAHADEQGVARVVAVGVVDGLEAVEVEEHHRERHLADDRQGLVELVLEQQPVAEAGERVVQGLVHEVVLGRAGAR